MLSIHRTQLQTIDLLTLANISISYDFNHFLKSVIKKRLKPDSDSRNKTLLSVSQAI